MVNSGSEPWYAPELRALLAFSSDGIPLCLMVLPLIVLWRTPFSQATEKSTITRVFLAVLVGIFAQYEVHERKIGYFGSLCGESLAGFYTAVLLVNLFGGGAYALAAAE